MGAVYAVERSDGAYAQRAALKLIRAAADSPAARERFLREEWPLVLERIQRLGLRMDDLLKPATDGGAA